MAEKNPQVPLGDVAVKLSNNEVVKISTVKKFDRYECGAISIENHLGEIWHFSPYQYYYARLMPQDV